MIDLKLVRQNPELMKDNIKKRNINIDLDSFLEMDKKIINLKQELDDIKNKKNTFSRIIPTLSKEEKQEKLAEMKSLWEREKDIAEEIKSLENDYNNIYYRLPNFLDETTAIWPDDSWNKVEFKFLSPIKFDFTPKAHYEIWEKKWWIDTDKWAEVSWARFWYIKWELVFLQFAIINYALSVLHSRWFLPVLPPVLVREQAMFWTWFLPAWEDWTYRVNPDDDDLYLVWTAEVPITSYHAWEIIEDLKNPIKYVWYSSCYRKEAWSAWKDMKWILRWHQFDKIEMVCFCRPEDSKDLHNEMSSIEEFIRQSLKIPYQKVNICSGDLWNPAMKKYDLEAWMPWQDKYREVTSCSNVWEYQSRRLWIRYRDTDWKPKYVHTLNGTVIALSRCLIAIIENYQTVKWDVIIPEVLRPFMWGKEIL